MALTPAEQAQLNALRDQQNELIEEQIKKEKRLASALTANQPALQFSLDTNKRIASEINNQLNLLAQTNASLDQQIETAKRHHAAEVTANSALTEKAQLLQQQLQTLQNIRSASEEVRQARVRELQAARQNTIELEKQSTAFEGFKTKIKGAMGVTTSFNNTVIGGMANALGGVAMQLEGIVQKAKAGGFSYRDFGRAAQALSGPILSATETLLHAQDGLTASFKSSTGASDRFTQSILGASSQLKSMALDHRAAGQAQTALYDGLTKFRSMTISAQQSMNLYVSTMGEFGMEMRSITSALDFFTNNLGMSDGAARRATSSIVNMARGIGMNANQALSQFNALAPQMAAHGNNATTVFRQLAAQSAATGLAMTDLTRVAAQFDTFQGAATAVGRLNGLLGGSYLNSVRMVYMTESQRMEAMHQALQLSGKTFDSMTRLERMALSNAAGFRDVAEAQRFYNNSLSSFQDKARQASVRQANFAKLAKEAKPALENLRLAMMQLAVDAKPLINALRGAIDGLSSFIRTAGGQATVKLLAFAGILSKVLGGVTALVTGFRALSLSSLAVIGPLGLLAAGVAYFGSQASKENSPAVFSLPNIMAQGFGAMATAADKAARPIQSLGGAIREVFTAGVTGNIERFADSMGKLGSGKGAMGTRSLSGLMATADDVSASEAANITKVADAAKQYAAASVNVHMAGARQMVNMVAASQGGGGGGGGGSQTAQKVINQPINFNLAGETVARQVIRIVESAGKISTSIM